MVLSWPRTILLAIYYYRKALLMGASFLFVWWLLLPGDKQININNCEPDDFLAQASEWVHGRAFWHAQLPFVRRNLALARDWGQNTAKSKSQEEAFTARADAQMEVLYAQHPELAPSVAERQATKLRAMADALEEAEEQEVLSKRMHKQAAITASCEAKILGMQ